MKLQIALDTVDTQQAIEILDTISEYIDIIEVGTPMIIDFGMEPVRKLKQKYPNLKVLADTKIMDAGEFEAAMAFKAGAELVTVMGITHDETIVGAVTAAHNFNGKIMADMMCVENLADRAKKLVDLGVDYICVHTAVDVQTTENPYDELMKIEKAVGSEHCAIAGGLNINTIHRVLPYNPEIVIVGNGITGQEDKKDVSVEIRKILDRK